MLMVLLAVIAVGLLQLATISLRSSSNDDAGQIARTNALLALDLAIAQLQRTAGPDQRITGPAKLASAEHPDAWAGVWIPGSVAGETLTTPVDLVTTGRKNYLVDSRAKSPDWKSSWFLEPLVSPRNGDTARMLKLGQWSNKDAIEAPEVKVAGNGGLAWWTEDLSQQASLAGGVNAEDAAEVGLSAAPRTDTSRLAGARLTVDYFTTSKDRQKALSVQSALLAANVTSIMPLGETGNARSYGLFTDPVRGGFKADLTRFVESDSKIMGKLPGFGLEGISAERSILPGNHHAKTGPRWERLRNWYQMPGAASGKIAGADPTAIRQASGAYCGEGWSLDAVRSSGMPMHPVIVDAGFHWDFTPVSVDSSRIHVHIYPRVTLWNPYNAPLAGKRYVVVMPRHFDSGGGLTVELEPRPGRSLPAIPPFTVINGWGEQFNAPQQASEHYFMFTVEATEFGPGECLVFTPSVGASGSSPYNAGVPSANMLTASQPVGTQNFYIEKRPNTTPENLPARLAQGYRVKRYVSGATNWGNLWLNWNPKPFFLKAAPNGALSASQVLQSNAYPTLQRLYVNDAGAGKSWFESNGTRSSYVQIKTDWNDSALNNGSAWAPLASNTDRRPPRSWYYRVHLSWIDDDAELASVPAGVAFPQPPYAAAALADWNPIASVVCRTPSTYVNEFFDLHVGCWYRCKAPYDAFGPDSNWGIFTNGKARGCPYGDPRNHAAKLSFPVIDIPETDLPLQSIATLRNAPLSPWTWHPLKLIGTSRPSLHADKDATAIPAIAGMSKPWDSTVTQTDRVFDDLVQAADSADQLLLYDIAYETNRELWDSTFASSWSALAGWDGTGRLPNRQYVPNPVLPGAYTVIERANASPGDFGLWLPAYLLTSEGAFNVNSLSPAAWSAFLGGLKKLVRTDAAGNPVQGDHPFSRFRRPASNDSEWGGGVGLSDGQIASLAGKIVEVVRERGPFLGMADFVNRRLASDATGNRGALDEALLRANLANPSLAEISSSPDDSDTKVNSANRCRYNNVSSRLMEGAAGYIEQSDLLEPLAGSLCARGDTFRIRATGCAYDKNGKLLQQVTCEAIVVRSPDFVVSASIDMPGGAATGNSALVPPSTFNGSKFVANPALNPLNRKFGRRFEILSQKWLTRTSEL
jgi:hypothetical protein